MKKVNIMKKLAILILIILPFGLSAQNSFIEELFNNYEDEACCNITSISGKELTTGILWKIKDKKTIDILKNVSGINIIVFYSGDKTTFNQLKEDGFMSKINTWYDSTTEIINKNQTTNFYFEENPEKIIKQILMIASGEYNLVMTFKCKEEISMNEFIELCDVLNANKKDIIRKALK